MKKLLRCLPSGMKTEFAVKDYKLRRPVAVNGAIVILAPFAVHVSTLVTTGQHANL